MVLPGTDSVLPGTDTSTLFVKHQKGAWEYFLLLKFISHGHVLLSPTLKISLFFSRSNWSIFSLPCFLKKNGQTKRAKKRNKNGQKDVYYTSGAISLAAVVVINSSSYEYNMLLSHELLMAKSKLSSPELNVEILAIISSQNKSFLKSRLL